jgi:hypothetical protein
MAWDAQIIANAANPAFRSKFRTFPFFIVCISFCFKALSGGLKGQIDALSKMKMVGQKKCGTPFQFSGCVIFGSPI